MFSLSQRAVYGTVPVEQVVLSLFKPDKAASRIRHWGTTQPLGRRTDGTHVGFESHAPPEMMDMTVLATGGCSLGRVGGPNGRQREDTLFGRDHHPPLVRCCQGRGKQLTDTGCLEV